MDAAETIVEPELVDVLLLDSRISPSGNGNNVDTQIFNAPTSGQKWWAAVIIGFIFALVSSPPAYNITTYLSSYTTGLKTIKSAGPTLYGLFIHTIIFIIIIRFILW